MTEFHNHGAAKSGVRSEASFKEALLEQQIVLLKTKEDFKKYYRSSLKEAQQKVKKFIHLPWPEDYEQDDPDKKHNHWVDGYLPQFDIIVELKYSEAKGTTEEKVMNDLEKMRDGAYDCGRPLLYVIFGPEAMQPIFKRFARKVKKFDPLEQRVKVILDTSPELSLVKEFLFSLSLGSHSFAA